MVDFSVDEDRVALCAHGPSSSLKMLGNILAKSSVKCGMERGMLVLDNNLNLPPNWKEILAQPIPSLEQRGFSNDSRIA
ncbi:hypothetical protein HY285_00730 [Candidatus Peregrinibacteria bacterium]|nr:hypothetical protein [Candidatus Peregrinibacteria bacterium]MBI3816055.1 hypothetical protein [Candidatus Peregrinibacteria bacterium]